MNTLLYLIIVLLPLPLLAFILARNHYLYCLPPFIAFIGIFLLNVIGAIEVINDKALFSYTYYFSLLSIIALFYIFYATIFRFKRALHIDWTVVRYEDANVIYTLLVPLWTISCLLLFLYYQRYGLPALFHISLNEYFDIYTLRADKSTNLPGGMHWYRFGFKTIPAFIFICTYILKCLNPTRKTKALFYLNLPLVLFFSTLTLHKTPIAYLLLYALLIKFFVAGKPLGFGRVLGYASLGVGTILVIFRLYLLDRGFIEILGKFPYYLFRRICIVYTKNHASIIQIFPDQHDFFFGKAYTNPGRLLPFEPVNLSQFLAFWVDGRLANKASPSFSQGYANFGFSGLLLTILLIFLQIMFIQFIFKKCPPNVIFLAIYVLLIPNMLGYAHNSIQAVASPIFILFSIACVVAFYFLKDFRLISEKFCRSN